VGAGPRQGERCRAARAARAEDQHAAIAQLHARFEGAQDAQVIGVVAV
jgi:hypothetical protein